MPLDTNPPPMSALSLLQQRRSVPSLQLGEPAPDQATLKRLLEAAIRVPDHGKLVPFRLLQLRGEAKQRFSERLGALALQNNPDVAEAAETWAALL
ncbi:MAG: nitroreductase family protein, partial [Rhodanobacter sp.]